MLGFDLLRALDVFACVADTGSMTAASTRLHLTQSAISQQIKQLEQELGGPLLDRASRPLRLTPAGITLRQRAAHLLAEAELARREVRDAMAGAVPHLRIAMLSTFAPALVPAVIEAAAAKRIPISTASFLRGLAANHTRQLIEREVDVIVTSNALYDVDQLQRHELVREQFLLVLPKGDPPAGLGEIARRLPFLHYTTRFQVGRMIELHFRRLRLEISRTHLFEAPDDLLAMVAAGHGWTVATPSQLVRLADSDDMPALHRLPGPAISRGITLVARNQELGDLPATLATLFRERLKRDHLSAVTRILPHLPGLYTVVENTRVT
jgi:DNA-binding transcriptional LysR family regulator